MLDAAGIHLYVETEGTGRPLILLPAGPGLDHAYFHPYLSALSPYATVVYFDPRGCGRSEAGAPAACRLETMVSDLEEVRRALGFESTDILGHGLGQTVAILYADRHPERAGRLVLLGGNPRAGSETDRYLSADGRLRERLRILAPLMFHRLGDRGFQRAFVDQVTTSDVVREAIAPELAKDAGLVSEALLARLKAPVLIVSGRHDPTAPTTEAESLRRAVPGSRLEIMEESGSFPFAEQPVEFLKVLRSFLAGEGPAGERVGAKTTGAGGGI